METIVTEFEETRIQAATNTLISISRLGNQYLNEKEPWNLLKTDREKAATVLYVAAQIVKTLAAISAVFMPSTAEKLWQTLKLPSTIQESNWEDALKPLEPGHKIAKAKPLFQKIEADEKVLDGMLQQVREKKGIKY